jgi:hypothetical protein
VSQGAAVTFTTTECQYTQSGRAVSIWVQLNITSAGTAGNPLEMSLPWRPHHGAGLILGVCEIFDASGPTRFVGDVAQIVTDGNILGFGVPGVGNSNLWGATPSTAIASGDILRMQANFVVD